MRILSMFRLGFILPVIATSFVTAEEFQCDVGCNTCERDFFASASFIYWQPIQDNMELGIASDNSDPLDLVDGKQVDLHSDFSPGFKLAMGMGFDCGRWDSVIQYTYFRSSQHVSSTLDPNNSALAFLPSWQIPSFLNPQYSSASERWKLSMDIIDWDIARRYSVCESITVRPFVGVRVALIDQSVHVQYTNVNPDDLFIWPSTAISQKTNSWGVGPRIGIGADWNFCQGWKVFGDAEFDILYTRYNVRSNQMSEVDYPNLYTVNENDKNYLRAHTELNVGLGWGSCIFDSCHLDLNLGYGFQIFFDQNMFRTAVGTQAVGRRILTNGNLYIQGLTVSASLDF